MAHVDHGKSTLADRFLELTKTVEPRKMKEQYLDRMDIERERGITIKMAPVKMRYTLEDTEYVLNLIDTPGHSDFGYEVSRALAAVEGAVLLVDATQGIQAQTIANYNIAKQLGLTIIPAINKIDLNPDVEDLKQDVAELVGGDENDIFLVSGKTGQGVSELLQAIIQKVPAPEISTEKNTRCLIFDSLFDSHKGIIAFVRVFDGAIQQQDKLWLHAISSKVDAFEVGYFSPDFTQAKSISAGDIGYIALGIKNPSQVRIGDTITLESQKDKIEPLEGYREPQPVVFASFYTQGADDFDTLKIAIDKLHLTDSSFTFEPESSDALGRGLRLGFLGTLHLEIIAERIRREFNVEVITTAPSVAYRIATKHGDERMVYKPQDFPEEGQILEIYEPVISIDIISRSEDYGAIMQLSAEYRMIYQKVDYFGKSVMVTFSMPLAELLGNFYDRLKSVTSGYASVNYKISGHQKATVAKMDILLANQEIPEFARILPKQRLERDARKFVQHLKEVLPRESFAVAIQARAMGRIIARENLPALKKDVTGHLYGGDRTRKMKLWKKQKKGKKKLLALARVNIPHEVYIKILKGEK